MRNRVPEENIKKSKKLTKRQKNRNPMHSFLTVVLLICLVQMSISALLNISKVIAYHTKISTLESKQISAEAKNDELKKEIKNFSTTASMESIARNNLKMAGKDEVLVIVNKKDTPSCEQKDKHKKIGFIKQ